MDTLSPDLLYMKEELFIHANVTLGFMEYSLRFTLKLEDKVKKVSKKMNWKINGKNQRG